MNDAPDPRLVATERMRRVATLGLLIRWRVDRPWRAAAWWLWLRWLARRGDVDPREGTTLTLRELGDELVAEPIAHG